MTNQHNRLPNLGNPEALQGEVFSSSQVELKEAPQTNEERLLELLSFPAEEVGELREQLHEITAQALATAINPHNREALMITARIAEWRLFGEPGSPLPFGLVQGHTDDGTLTILYGRRPNFGLECAQAALDNLHTTGLCELDKNFGKLIDERWAEIQEVFSNTIKTSQAFQFITALVGSGQPQQPQEQPLTPFWRAIRETQINQTVRTRWGLEPQEQIMPHTEPDYDLRRGLCRLGDETRPMLAKPNGDPLSRLRLYLGGLVQAEFTKGNPNEVFVGFEADDEGYDVVRTMQKPEDYTDPANWIEAAARKLALQINEPEPYVQLITEDWLYFLTQAILWPKETPQEFEQLSQNAIDEAWECFEDIVRDSRRFGAADYNLRMNRESRIHAALVRPSGVYTDLSRLDEDTSYNHEHYGAPQYSKAEIITPFDKQVGEVLHFSPNARGQHACRLIQSEPKQADLPPLNGDEELVLRLFGKEFEYAQPYIPGYYLMSNSRDMYGFVPDKMGDPYASADIQLTPEQRHTLAARYDGIGLHNLARLVEHSSRLTVQRLTSLVDEESFYITPSKAKNMRPPLSRLEYVSNLEDFRWLVRGGSLQVQCTGAAKFLRFSLEEMFGKGSAATTDGYKLSRRTISTSAQHEQTAFTNQGHIYLLDATPSSTEGTNYDDYLFDGKSMQFRHPSLPLAVPRMAQINAHIPRMAEKGISEQSREQRIQAIRQSLDTQLMGLLQARDRNAVYEKTNALPRDDPFRVTVETTLRATSGEATRDEVERLHRYLAAYKDADEGLRRQIGVPSYDAQTVQILQNTAEQLLGEF